MRLRILVVIALSIIASLMLQAQEPPPDYNATGTAIAREATQTAQAQQPPPTVDDGNYDPFQLTSTALVREATQTAEAFTGNTAVPITDTPQGDISAQESATALVRNATQTARAQAQSDGDADDDNAPLGLAGLLVAVVMGILAIIGGALGFGGDDSEANEKDVPQ